MQHDQFIGHVQDRADLDSRGSAEAATRATLETLGERLAGGEPDNLAAQLPPEIGLHLGRGDGRGDPFDVEEFYRRVAERQGPGTDTADAAFHASAVLSVVRDAVTGSVLERVAAQLPPEYEPVLEFADAR